MVELLIVIALLGIIAIIVIAAINPIEQANRARDTGLKTDSGQLISAIDRYFAAFNEFPWVTAGQVNSNDASYGFISAGNEGLGICGATCTVDGVLITSGELKTEFRNRDFIKATAPDKQIFVGKAQGTSESIYACFIPAAKATRDRAIADDNVFTINTSTGARSQTSACDAAGSDWVAGGCYVCIPE